MPHGYVYVVENLVNGKIYVGQTTDLKARENAHLNKKRKHSIINSAVQKYGKESFEFILLESCISQEQLNEREIYWINQLSTLSPNGYNLKEGGDGGGKHSEETKEKIRQRRLGHRGYKHTDEARQLIRESKWGAKNPFFGKKHSEETRNKISLASKGSNNPFYGKTHSQIVKDKLSKLKRNIPETSLIKMRMVNVGKKHSEETRTKMSISHIGKSVSVEAKLKLSEAQKENWKKKLTNNENHNASLEKRQKHSEFMKCLWAERKGRKSNVNS